MKWRATIRGQLATEAGELSTKGKHAEALDLLEQALVLDPDDPLVLVYRGRVLHALGQSDDAEQSLRKALSIDEGLFLAWNEYGMLLESTGAYEKAAFCYDRSAKIDPNVYVLTKLANVQLVFDPHKALENAERALSMDPDWDEAQVAREAAKSQIRPRRDG